MSGYVRRAMLLPYSGRIFQGLSKHRNRGGESVKIQKIRDIARDQGLQPGKAEKVELIGAIQRREGNFDCFATARSRKDS